MKKILFGLLIVALMAGVVFAAEQEVNIQAEGAAFVTAPETADLTLVLVDEEAGGDATTDIVDQDVNVRTNEDGTLEVSQDAAMAGGDVYVKINNVLLAVGTPNPLAATIATAPTGFLGEDIAADLQGFCDDLYALAPAAYQCNLTYTFAP